MATFNCTAEEITVKESPTVASVFDKKITADDIDLKYDGSNKPIFPKDSQSTCLLQDPTGKLLTKIIIEVSRDYIDKNNLNSTDEEIREFNEFKSRFWAQDKIKNQKKLADLDKKLQDTKLSKEEKEQAEKYRETLLSLAFHEKQLEERNYKPTPEALRESARLWIEGLKFNKSIYERYGGVVGITKFGPDPIGATKALLTDYEKNGTLVFHDENLRSNFWERLSLQPRFTADKEEIDFTPYWKKPLPENEE